MLNQSMCSENKPWPLESLNSVSVLCVGHFGGPFGLEAIQTSNSFEAPDRFGTVIQLCLLAVKQMPKAFASER